MARGTVRLPAEQLEPYLCEVPAEPVLLNFAELFGNDNPVELEVGFGKGLFLLTASEAHPEINFLGIEIERKYVFHTANRIAKRKHRNVRLVCADARTFLPGYVGDESLQAIHVYFPDPWWKNRHRKRRLFTEDFAHQCQRILRPDGRLHVVSDVDDYFHIMTDLLDGQPQLEKGKPPDEKTPEHDLDYLTNYDRKFRKEGRAVYRALYWKK